MYYFRLVFLAICLLLASEKAVQAQGLANQWVNYGLTYYKFPIGADGVYRVNAQLLAQLYPDLATKNANFFRVFYRGTELPTVKETGGDNIFNGNDYIDFYAEINKGQDEVGLFQPANAHQDNIRSYYQDTSFVFLTWQSEIEGKRMLNPGLINDPNVAFETYMWTEAKTLFRSNYSPGVGNIQEQSKMHSSYFNYGEGWTGPPFNESGPEGFMSFVQSGINNYNYSANVQPTLELLMSGRNQVAHRIEILLGSQQNMVGMTQFKGFRHGKLNAEFSKDNIEGTNLTIRARPLGGNDRVSFTWAKVKYPAVFELENNFFSRQFSLPRNQSNYSRVRFTNLGSVPYLLDVTDLLNPINIGTSFLNGQLIAGINGTAADRSFHIQRQPILFTASQAKEVRFQNLPIGSIDLLIVFNNRLAKPTGSYANPVQAYQAFRQSAAGGNYRVSAIEIEQVFDQFCYGNRHPKALKNMSAVLASGGEVPKGIFLLGKGLHINNMNRADSTLRQFNLIPPLGYPASDNIMSVNLRGSGDVPLIPVGRLSVTQPSQLAAYLDKLIEYEAFDFDALWKKHLFHMSGGITQFEQNTFKALVVDFGSQVLTQHLGGKVGMYHKNSNQTVEYVNVKSQVNSGLSMLTVFGHSSTSGADVDIGNVADPNQGYQNRGKYPTIFVNGCYTGNTFEIGATLSENWVLTPQKGAIAFVSSLDEALPSYLQRFTRAFYRNTFQDSANFGKPIGRILKSTYSEFRRQSNNVFDSIHADQFCLHGDPMLRIFGAEKPDYKTSSAEVSLADESGSAQALALNLKLVVSNFGKYNDDTLLVGVNRRMIDGKVQNFYFKFPSVSYKDTLKLSIPQPPGFNYGGINRFEIKLDPFDVVDEMKKANNVAIREFLVPQTGLNALFPKKYGIVNSRSVALRAQATDLFTRSRRYRFELDTSFTFNSPLKKSDEIIAGNLASWNTLLPTEKDSLVYYWRVKFADSPQDTAWKRMSFTYIANGSEGWAQGPIYQFIESTDVGISKNFSQRKWDFPESRLQIDMRISGGQTPNPVYNLNFNGVPMLYGTSNTGCDRSDNNRLVTATLNPSTLGSRVFNYFGVEFFYVTSCGRLPFALNNFLQAPTPSSVNRHFDNYLKNFVRPGEYVLLFTTRNFRWTQLADSVKRRFEFIGVPYDSIARLQDGDAVIILGRKGSPIGSATIVMPNRNGNIPTNQQILNFQTTLTALSNEGSITSSLIGPASKWGSLFSQIRSAEQSPADQTNLELIGVDNNGQDSLLSVKPDQVNFDLSWLDARQFPFLKLRAQVKDTAFGTPSLIRRWLVAFEGVPEGTLNTSLYPEGTYQTGVYQEGQALSLPFAFTNISNRTFNEKLKVNVQLNNQLYQEIELDTLAPNETVQFSLDSVSTEGLNGLNKLSVFVNPRLQPEEYFDNNVMELPVEVVADKTLPVLDVLFDGVVIGNGDVVSPSPLIAISLKDENRIRWKKDTLGFEILLTNPQGTTQRIPLTSPDIEVFPANGPSDLFRINFHPKNLEDGKYRLSVQGADASGNMSASAAYQVDFQVISKPSITYFFPYPNPFSTGTRFTFTLTGTVLPEDFVIQIFTPTGRMVKQIPKSEFGTLRIGSNISEYRWEGTDSQGKRLANGLYLYKVVLKDDAGVFTHRPTAADHTISNGFGKLSILR